MPLVESSNYILIPKRLARRTAIGLALGTAGLLLSHPVWLTWLGRLLIVDEAPQPAAAIVVLGGGNGERDATAARLWAAPFHGLRFMAQPRCYP